MKTRQVGLFILTIALAGCMTPQQRAERDIARHAPYCERLGFKQDTDAWSSCIASTAAQRDGDDAAASRAAAAARPKVCTMVGVHMVCN